MDKQVLTIYTDGSCLRNPGGKGGIGVVYEFNGLRKCLSRGYRSTTNNRMELLACIIAVQFVQKFIGRVKIIVHSDSKYVVDSIMKRWVYNWKSRGWTRKGQKPPKNIDLWKQLVEMIEDKDIEFRWVKGHDESELNNKCDELAYQAAVEEKNMIEDVGYEK